jgi:hypothetical protein
VQATTDRRRQKGPMQCETPVRSSQCAGMFGVEDGRGELGKHGIPPCSSIGMTASIRTCSVVVLRYCSSTSALCAYLCGWTVAKEGRDCDALVNKSENPEPLSGLGRSPLTWSPVCSIFPNRTSLTPSQPNLTTWRSLLVLPTRLACAPAAGAQEW